MPKPLRFTPYAWAKLRHLRDCGDTEIGCFGLAEYQDDPLLITDLIVPDQECTEVTVELDGASLGEEFAAWAAAGHTNEHYARVWIHTHPEMSAKPSSVDEKTFAKLFGSAEWGIMAILSKTEDTYARVGYGRGPGASAELKIEVDFDVDFAAVGDDERAEWDDIYLTRVKDVSPPPTPKTQWQSAPTIPPKRPSFRDKVAAHDREREEQDALIAARFQDPWENEDVRPKWLDHYRCDTCGLEFTDGDEYITWPRCPTCNSNEITWIDATRQ